jgi:hypothetical protein
MARARGIRLTFSDCSPQHLRMYKSLGYSRYGSYFNDPVFGKKITILWVMGDLEMLRERRSPMLGVCAQFGDDPEARAWHRQTIAPTETDAAASDYSAATVIAPRPNYGGNHVHQ